MNLTPHEKTKTLIIVYGGTLVTGVIAFLLWKLLSPFIMGGGSVIALCGFGIAFIIQGIRRLREARSHGQIISWYQQPSLILGLITCSCILAVGIIFICSTVIHIHSRLLSHLTTIFCILAVLPVFFYIKHSTRTNPPFKKSADQDASEHTGQVTNDQHLKGI